MPIGAFFPNLAFNNDPEAIREWAQAVEALGYDYIDVPDHTVAVDRASRPEFRGPYDITNPYHETFVTMGFLAAVTRRVRLKSSVLILPQRQTALVAKQAVEVDVLSGGRLDLGIGVGWNPIEYEALGQDWHSRGRRQAQQVEAMQRLWCDPIVQFEGEWDLLKGVGLNPGAVQRPIPLWFGGSVDATLRRAAKSGAGWIPLGDPDDTSAERLERLRGFLREESRDPAEFGIECWIRTQEPDPATWLQTARKWQEMGATHVTLYTAGTYLGPLSEQIDALTRFKALMSGGGV
jgi:probable F420-dependent oxidoreductase